MGLYSLHKLFIIAIIAISCCFQYRDQLSLFHLERHQEGGPGAHNAEGTDVIIVTLLIKLIILTFEQLQY